MADSTQLPKEARDLLQLFSLQVKDQIAQATQAVMAEVSSVKEHTERRIDALRAEQSLHLTEIKMEQRDQRKILEVQGKELTEVKVRLEEGDKRFEKLEDEVSELKVSDKSQGKSIAFLSGIGAAAGAAGGAVSAAVSHLLK